MKFSHCLLVAGVIRWSGPPVWRKALLPHRNPRINQRLPPCVALLRAIDLNPHALVKPAQARASTEQPVTPAFHRRIVTRLSHRIGCNVVSWQRLAFRHCHQIGTRRAPDQSAATAHKQEHGQQG